MNSYTFDVVVFGGPSAAVNRSETAFKTTFKAESVFSAVCALIGIFSGCKWFAVRAYVDTPDSQWMQYVTLYDTENGFSSYVDSASVA